MTAPSNSVTEASFIDAPRDGYIRALYEYWDSVRRGRAMPSRVDIDPVKIPKLLPYIIMYNVAAGGGHTVRLVGEEVQRFVGRNTMGTPAGSYMPPRSALRRDDDQDP